MPFRWIKYRAVGPKCQRAFHLPASFSGPLSAHANKLYGPDEINGILFDARETHEHVFYDSLTKDGSLRQNACEQARKVNVEIRDFATGLRYACDRINIVNPEEVPPPADQGTLL